MEKNIAILMADLSGYTALTETHGAVTAADLVDKYIRIAKDCLVGDTRIHQCTGDEIMFVSDSPDFLLGTALKLEAATEGEENFLQVHGGLHFGKILNRANNYYGTTINLASRIASTAGAGTFWCSEDFVNALEDKTVCTFLFKGRHQFKNINGEKEVFELGIEKSRNRHIDPVCRMLILDTRNSISHPDDEEIYFCSSQCLNIHREGKRVAQSMYN